MSAQGQPSLAAAALAQVLQTLPAQGWERTCEHGVSQAGAQRRGEEAREAASVAACLATPAEVTLKTFFAAHPSAGRRDRQRIADRVFNVLRHLRRLRWLAQGDEKASPGAGRVEKASPGAGRVEKASPGAGRVEKASPKAGRMDGGTLDVAVGARADCADADRLRPDLARPAHSRESHAIAAALLELAESPQSAALPQSAASPRPPIAYSLPDWLWHALCESHGETLTTDVAAAMLEPAALQLRVNLLRARPKEVQAALAAAGIDARPVPGVREALVVSGRPTLELLPAFQRGAFEVQDLGSQALARFCDARRGQFVVDLCAGAAGKTLALASHMRNQGHLLACDINATRLAAAEPRLARAGVDIARLLRISDVDDVRLEKYHGRADLVLVDAPCSGTGTLQRHPDLKWRMSPAWVAELAVRQRRLLRSAARLVRPGGVLVYGTCSLLHDENDAQVQWAAAAREIGGRASQPPSIERWLPHSADVVSGAITGGYFAAKWRLDLTER